VLREQLGEKLVKLSGADFSASRPPPPRKPPHDERRDNETRPVAHQKRLEKAKRRTSSDHAWRVHEEGQRTKKLYRKFHRTRSDRQELPERIERAQSDTLTDRKGRQVPVERYPPTSPAETARQDDRGFRRKSDHHRNRTSRRRSRMPPRGKR